MRRPRRIIRTRRRMLRRALIVLVVLLVLVVLFVARTGLGSRGRRSDSPRSVPAMSHFAAANPPSVIPAASGNPDFRPYNMTWMPVLPGRTGMTAYGRPSFLTTMENASALAAAPRTVAVAIGR